MIHALPGMGADHRMYPSPWNSLPGFMAHDWPAYEGQQTIEELAQTVCTQLSIQDGDTLIGSSLGSIVACDIVKLRGIQALFLIGGATDQRDVNRLLAILHPLISVMPIDLLRFTAGSIPNDLARMFTTVEASFMKAMCRAIFHWNGLGETDVRVFRIHGQSDLIIPPPPKVDLLLDGGHLISMTHALECVRYITANSSFV